MTDWFPFLLLTHLGVGCMMFALGWLYGRAKP